MRPLLSLLVLLVLSAALPSGAEPPAKKKVPLEAALAGTWGFELEGGTCDVNPHRISFSQDRMTMELRYSKGVNGKPAAEATYRVKGKGKDFLRMKMDGEKRRSDRGILVEWDLVLVTPDSYCWRRTDWEPDDCTVEAIRCPEAADPKAEPGG